MSELDFDELDKAVNTLMGDVPRVEPPKTDDVKTLNISSTLSDASRPSLADLNSALSQVNGTPAASVTPSATPVTPPAASPAPTPAPQPVRTTTPPLATRRGGRFMDVVHPSSDMKGIAKPSLSGSRQGVTIEPTSRPVEDTVQPTPVVPAAPSAEEVNAYESLDTAAPAPELASPATHEATNDWPDPLDMPGYESETNTPEVADIIDTPTTPASLPPSHETSVDDEADDDALFSLDDINETEDDEPQPLNSPFLADAKVEKRPLGGTQTDESDEELSHAPVLGVLVDQAADETKAEDQLPASPRDVQPQLPPELQSDLMAIETDGDTTTSSSASSVSEPEQKDDAPVAEPEVTAAAVPATQPVAETTPVVTGPTSIPQQYHEEQSTGDQPAGSIYDTESYHQPLAHPAKTKSGWLWIIWILLLLIVGGGGAVALYFLGII